ncbi:MAG: hypothetical protein LBF87_03840 [Treponema sp.]|nr:hypothetical protein [Treponema sp.]
MARAADFLDEINDPRRTAYGNIGNGNGVSTITAVPKLLDMLDIVFREDECRVRTGNAALNLNILRKMALHRLRKMTMEKKRVSAKRRMMHAALNEDFLYQALFAE